MNVSDILTLAKAGFNSEQISKIASLEKTNSSEPEKQPVFDFMQAAKNLSETAQNITAMMQTSNLKAEQPKAESPEEILASIINPKEVK